jgi:hypothetical protein
MLLHLPIVLASMLSPVAATEAVPKFDIVRECRFEGGSTAAFDRCSEDEATALKKLQSRWAQFSDADKKTCIASATIGNLASYVDLQICLEMSRDIKSESDSQPGPQTTDAMRLRSPGVTVGVGHDPITTERAPDKDIPSLDCRSVCALPFNRD